MKKIRIISIIIILVAVALLSACRQTTVNSESLTESTTEGVSSAQISVSETETETTEISSQSDNTTEIEVKQPIEQTATTRSTNSETQTISQKNRDSENTETTSTTKPTTTKKVTTTAKPTTTKQETTTKKPTTTKKETTTKKSVDIDYYVNYAKDYGKSVGLHYDSSATDCWDNPISVTATNGDSAKSSIKSRLNRYKNIEDFTDFCVWAEKRSDGGYNLYIGYA